MLSSIQLTPFRVAIIVMTVATAVIHFSLGDLIFILNGLGYLALLSIFILPFFTRWREVARWLLVAFAAATIVSFFILHPNGTWQMDSLGVITKFIEFILILTLFAEMQPATEADQEQLV